MSNVPFHTITWFLFPLKGLQVFVAQSAGFHRPAVFELMMLGVCAFECFLLLQGSHIFPWRSRLTSRSLKMVFLHQSTFQGGIWKGLKEVNVLQHLINTVQSSNCCSSSAFKKYMFKWKLSEIMRTEIMLETLKILLQQLHPQTLICISFLFVKGQIFMCECKNKMLTSQQSKIR